MREPEEQAALERLQMIDKLEAALEALVWEAREFRSRIDGVGAMRYDGAKVLSSPKGDAIPDSVARNEAYTKKIVEAQERCRTTRLQIIDEIAKVREPLHVRILLERYVKGRSFEQIAQMLYYSYSHITHEHNKALRAFWEANIRRDNVAIQSVKDQL